MMREKVQSNSSKIIHSHRKKQIFCFEQIKLAQMQQMKKQLCRPITCNKCQKLVTKWIDIAKPANVRIFDVQARADIAK